MKNQALPQRGCVSRMYQLTTWPARGSGANACFVTDPEDLVVGLTPLPSDSPVVEREARIIEWTERDDGITEAQAVQFFSWEEFSRLPEPFPYYLGVLVWRRGHRDASDRQLPRVYGKVKGTERNFHRFGGG